jgi:integrase
MGQQMGQHEQFTHHSSRLTFADYASGWCETYRGRTSGNSRDEAVLANAAGHHRPFLCFLAETGLSIGEAAALQSSGLDLKRDRIHVVRRFYQSTIDKPKSKFGTRVIPLTPGTIDELRERREALQPAEPIPSS